MDTVIAGSGPLTPSDRDRRHALNGQPQALGHRGRRRDIDARQQDREFFSAVSRREILRPEGRRQCLGHARQHGVSDQVALLVVDPLEVIQIDHQQRHRLVRPGGAIELPRKRIVEPPAVAEAGQAIHGRDALEIPLQPARLAEHLIVVPDAPREEAQKISRHVRRRINQLPKLLAVERQHDGRFLGDDICRNRLAVEDGNLADTVARFEAVR